MYVACFVNLAIENFLKKKKSLIQYLVRLSVLLHHDLQVYRCINMIITPIHLCITQTIIFILCAKYDTKLTILLSI